MPGVPVERKKGLAVNDQGSAPDLPGGEADRWVPFEVAHRRVAQVLGLEPQPAAVWLNERTTAERIEVKDDPDGWRRRIPAAQSPIILFGRHSGERPISSWS
jgi:hypothetical protein